MSCPSQNNFIGLPPRSILNSRPWLYTHSYQAFTRVSTYRPELCGPRWIRPIGKPSSPRTERVEALIEPWSCRYASTHVPCSRFQQRIYITFPQKPPSTKVGVTSSSSQRPVSCRCIALYFSWFVPRVSRVISAWPNQVAHPYVTVALTQRRHVEARDKRELLRVVLPPTLIVFNTEKESIGHCST